MGLPEGDKGWWLVGGASDDSQAPYVSGHRMVLPSLNVPFAPPLLPPLDTQQPFTLSPCFMQKLLSDLLYQLAVAT